MFQSIRNFFRDAFLVNPQPDIEVLFSENVLTQSELQMLQRVVADAIFEQETYWKGAKYDAQIHPVGSEERNFWFKQARKSQAKLKKFSALQYRLKHKIAARG